MRHFKRERWVWPAFLLAGLLSTMAGYHRGEPTLAGTPAQAADPCTECIFKCEWHICGSGEGSCSNQSCTPLCCHEVMECYQLPPCHCEGRGMCPLIPEN
jgi:hypothetical protein